MPENAGSEKSDTEFITIDFQKFSSRRVSFQPQKPTKPDLDQEDAPEVVMGQII